MTAQTVQLYRIYRRLAYIACLLSCVLFCCKSASASDPYYYPVQPPNATLQTATGTLVDYGLGRSRGTIVIEKSDGSRALFWMASRPLKINGVGVYCQFWWLSTCTDWPSSVIVGKTRVTVTYWTQTISGQRVSFSNSFTTTR